MSAKNLFALRWPSIFPKFAIGSTFVFAHPMWVIHMLCHEFLPNLTRLAMLGFIFEEGGPCPPLCGPAFIGFLGVIALGNLIHIIQAGGLSYNTSCMAQTD